MNDTTIRSRAGVTAKQIEQTVGFDLVAYAANPERLRHAETGERAIGSAVMGDKLVVLWPGRLCADTYVAAGMRCLRLAAITETAEL